MDLFNFKWQLNKHEQNVKDKQRSRVYDIRIKNYDKLSGVRAITNSIIFNFYLLIDQGKQVRTI